MTVNFTIIYDKFTLYLHNLFTDSYLQTDLLPHLYFVNPIAIENN